MNSVLSERPVSWARSYVNRGGELAMAEKTNESRGRESATAAAKRWPRREKLAAVGHCLCDAFPPTDHGFDDLLAQLSARTNIERK